jgi:hypothetical protein
VATYLKEEGWGWVWGVGVGEGVGYSHKRTGPFSIPTLRPIPHPSNGVVGGREKGVSGITLATRKY